MDIVYQNVQTNVKLSDVKDYLPYAIEFSTENIQTGSLPGTTALLNKLWFFEYNKTETQKLIQELFYNKEKTGEETTLEGSTEVTQITTTEAARIKIELLNGSGNSKTLTEVTNLLKKKGYNVYKTGTTAINSNTTIIKNAEVKDDIITNIKSLLKVGTISDSATNAQSKADVTIIIGKDYK